MKLVIDRDRTKAGNPWRWSIVTVHGMTVKIHAQGEAATAQLAFDAGYAVAVSQYGAEKESGTPVAK